MIGSEVALRLLTYSKASLLYSLEGLAQDDLVWQPRAGICSIGWHVCHVALFRGAFMWFFDPNPDWDTLGPIREFGYGSDPDALRDRIPAWAEIVRLIHEDADYVRSRLSKFDEAAFGQPVPLNNPDGETLFEMCYRTAWHCDIHIGQLCTLRELLGKPIFPRPPFGTLARRNWQRKSSTQWEKILAFVTDD